MVDLAMVASKCYYVFGSAGGFSIKKLLLPTMAASARLKELYEQPTYNGMNFSNHQWWQPAENEASGANRSRIPVKDPYSLLKSEGQDAGAFLDGNSLVADGGDAIVAYDTLQRADLDPMIRNQIQTSLLRYCELDTLAMVMIVQAWQEFLEQ